MLSFVNTIDCGLLLDNPLIDFKPLRKCAASAIKRSQRLPHACVRD
jgi:hypothetical protein